SGEFVSKNAGFGGSGSLSAAGNGNAFLLKLNAADGTPVTTFNGSGQLKWGGTGTGGRYDETGFTVVVDHAGNVFMGGSFDSPDASFNGAGASIAALKIDGYVIKVDGTTGAPVTTFGGTGMIRFGGPEFDTFGNFVVDANNDLILSAVETGAL